MEAKLAEKEEELELKGHTSSFPPSSPEEESQRTGAAPFPAGVGN